MTHHSIVLEPDGPGSYKFKFATGRGEISGRVRVGQEGPPDNRSEADQEQAALNQGTLKRVRPGLRRLADTEGEMDEIEVTRNGRTDQFSITLVRGADTIRCMVSVALGGTDRRSDDEKHRAALSKAKALAKALDSAIENS